MLPEDRDPAALGFPEVLDFEDAGEHRGRNDALAKAPLPDSRLVADLVVQPLVGVDLAVRSLAFDQQQAIAQANGEIGARAAYIGLPAEFARLQELPRVYDLVLLWAAGRAQQGLAGCWVDRPWYRRKTAPSFMDLLTVLRLEAWRTRLFDPAWPARASIIHRHRGPKACSLPPDWRNSSLEAASAYARIFDFWPPLGAVVGLVQ